MENSFKIISLGDEVESLSETSELEAALRNFKCSRNKDIETFLTNKAIGFEREHRARTFLIVSSSRVEAFFTLSLNILDTAGLSKTRIQNLSPHHNKNDKAIPCFLIGQLAKCDDAQIKGSMVLDTAILFLIEAHKIVGTKFVILDSINEPKVVKFYNEHGFVPVGLNTGADLKQVKMIRYLH